ncbi:nucleotidyltransferase domain-containing protein [Streptomyces sp. SL13]|uniref:Nucleotidyltransferase domain-containing protein n=1 Tax=Streptantibioticus silvisoli TaxID=2705255 RepID=A0AA90KFX1_9ACTN|nr:nucleotidyltransferase domain-containing protein [Streptantibioticus silvisoli]MDI5969434.1 nucleotidyltransferase domain-containing protein [Streptantibioticus silvisoli]
MSTSVSALSELPAIEELAHAHRPVQLAVLGDLVHALSATPAVTHLLVRGSLATGTADRLSDVDLVVAVRDE